MTDKKQKEGQDSPEREEFLKSLKDIAQRLDVIDARANVKKPSKNSSMGKDMGIGLRVLVEMICNIVVGAVIGYGLDRWFDTSPWFFVLFFLIGSVAGILTAVRTSRSYEERKAKEKEQSVDL